MSLKEAIALEASKAPPLHVWRRIFARAFDSILYISLVIVLLRERAIEGFTGESMMQFLPMGIAYVILDGLMTHVWKCSPGKFLLGMRVTDSSGNAIALKAALLRSLRVWLIGLGMWKLWVLSLPISWLLSRKFGYFLWDIPYRYRIEAKKFSGKHVMAYIAGFIAIQILMVVALPQEFVDSVNQQSGAQELIDQFKEQLAEPK